MTTTSIPDDECFKAYVCNRPRSSFSSTKDVHDLISSVSKERTYVLLDFSSLDLTDDDLIALFDGLVERELEVKKTHVGFTLQLLNISSDCLTNDGLRKFLIRLQKGVTVDGKKIFPDVRQTAIVVGFPISEEFFRSLTGDAPSVFAGGLKLLC